MRVLLFGAGASCEAGLPDSRRLTARIIQAFDASRDHAASAVLQYIVGGLALRQAVAETFDTAARFTNIVDIEAVVRALDALANRDKSESSLFISTWNPLVEQIERAHPRIFHTVRSRLLQHLQELLWLADAGRLEYLAPLIRLIESEGVVWIGTLNFDNTVETFARTRDIPISAGLDPARGYVPNRGYEFFFSTTGINLIKLHGSIDWIMHDAPPAMHGFVPLRFTLPHPRPTSAHTHSEPAILLGPENKLTAEGPYLSLLLRFQEALRAADRLAIVGYSFRDPHINEQIGMFLNRNPLNRIQIIDPTPPRHNYFLRRVLASCPDRCELLEIPAGAGLSALVTGVPSA